MEAASELYAAFIDEQLRIRGANPCGCAAYEDVLALRLKFVAHAGEGALLSRGGQPDLAGLPVILAHRLLKNTVPPTEYLLMTDEFTAGLETELGGRRVRARLHGGGPMTLHADKWGPLGGTFTALCCLGVAPVMGALTAAGLGFLLRDAILIPLLALFLAVTIGSLRRDRRRHGRATPERLSWVAAVVTVAGLWVSAVVTALGLVLLVSASASNAWLVWSARRAGRLKEDEA